MLNGFDKIINRLKMQEEFYSSAWEVEVASFYLNKGYQVEFIEEGKDKSPDLKITTDENKTFWAECKCRDIYTERDKKINKFWDDLESALLRNLGPNKINAFIIIKSLRDPEAKELDTLKTFLFTCINSACKSIKKIHSFIEPITKNYEIAITILSQPDEEITSSSLTFNLSEKLDRMKHSCDFQINQNNKPIIKNPIFIGFKNVKESDKVSGIIDGFKKAVKQLPEEGPGVVWIKVPDNAWNDNLEKSFLEAEALLKSKFTKGQNTRVNVVHLLTRLIHKIENEENNGLSYKPLVLSVENKNPKVNFLEN
ncbi:hypothetical protein [Sulfurimonas marina]|uniref:Restriction endonuclease n=1 Tax=Sulfurimonas marina TaxID=2590551 RepID=A0A7M1AXU7_9BACT|nr:hypothetical protein [Sulfurimonas marina]QOP42146.1 hypothetical protein FJR03_10530 [Sulfurimonas marina]